MINIHTADDLIQLQSLPLDQKILLTQKRIREWYDHYDGQIYVSFWTEQDILEYLRRYNLPYASVYGDIVEREGKLQTTGCSRTGCVYCAFGCHLDAGENRFQRLKRTHPQLWSYCMDKLGMREVLSYINVPIE